VSGRRAKCQQDDDLMCKFVKKIRLLMSNQMQSDNSSRKNRQQEDDSLRKFVKKKTSRNVELDVKWRVVA